MNETENRPKRQQQHFRFPVDLLEQVEKRKAQTGLTKTRLWEFAMRAYLKRNPQVQP